MRYLLFCWLLAIPLSAQTQRQVRGESQGTGKARESSTVRYLNPTGLAQNPRFSALVEINGGRTILISGQVAYDRDGNLVGKDDIRAQSTQVFENLKIALDAVGATFNDVVKLNTFMVDLPANLPGYRDVRGQYLAKNEHPPTSTTVGVSGLVNPSLLLEVEAVVVVPQKRSR